MCHKVRHYFFPYEVLKLFAENCSETDWSVVSSRVTGLPSKSWENGRIFSREIFVDLREILKKKVDRALIALKVLKHPQALFHVRV